ncbi:hypothetical protein ACFQVC_13610 [Streptomyces monticola]|uniref:Lipoprotein n=1 Tax=Streptomyces monticola TaxID=2666263 RepID=A0ABW2JI60_9ACTN
MKVQSRFALAGGLLAAGALLTLTGCDNGAKKGQDTPSTPPASTAPSKSAEQRGRETGRDAEEKGREIGREAEKKGREAGREAEEKAREKAREAEQKGRETGEKWREYGESHRG